MRVRSPPARGLWLTMLTIGLLAAVIEAKSKAQILDEIDSSISRILADFESLRFLVVHTTSPGFTTIPVYSANFSNDAVREAESPATNTTDTTSENDESANNSTDISTGTESTITVITDLSTGTELTTTVTPDTSTTIESTTTVTTDTTSDTTDTFTGTELTTTVTTDTSTNIESTTTVTTDTTSDTTDTSTGTELTTTVTTDTSTNIESTTTVTTDTPVPKQLDVLNEAVKVVQKVTNEVAEGTIVESQTDELVREEINVSAVRENPDPDLISYLQDDPTILDEMIETTSTSKKSVGNAMESENMKINLIIVGSVLGGLLFIVTVAFITVYFTKVHKRPSKAGAKSHNHHTDQLPLQTLHQQDDLFGEGYDNAALQEQPIRAPMRASLSHGPVMESRPADYPQRSEVHDDRRPSRIRLESKQRMSSQLNDLGKYEPPRLVDDQRSAQPARWNASPERPPSRRPASKQRGVDGVNQSVDASLKYGRSPRESVPHTPPTEYDYKPNNRRPRETSRHSNDNFSYGSPPDTTTSTHREPSRTDYRPRSGYRVEQDNPYGGPAIPPKPQKIIRPMDDGDIDRARQQPQPPRRDRRDMRGPYGPGDVY